MTTTAPAPETTTTPAIGTPLFSEQGAGLGYIVAIRDATEGSFMIGAAGMVPNTHHVTIAWESGGTSDTPLSIAQPWLDDSRAADVLPIINAPELLDIAKRQQAGEQARQRVSAALVAERKAAFADTVRAIMPELAQAVIVAERHVDKSDSMSDYWGHSVAETVILAFSFHGRDLFPEMRKAARNFEGTAHLADAPKNAEHREKYAMGGGFYLKEGNRDSDGWSINKRSITSAYSNDRASQVPMGVLHLTPLKPAKATTAPANQAPATTEAAYTIGEYTHTKKGFQMWLVTGAERTSREVFEEQRDTARELGGWWSRKWAQTPAGFAFKDNASAVQFAGQTYRIESAVKSQNPAVKSDAPKSAGNPALATKLRGLADGMQAGISGKLSDRDTNTNKRRYQAACARIDGHQMQRAQAGLNALADLWDAGTVPTELQAVKSKKAAMELADCAKDSSNRGYYDAPICHDKPSQGTAQALAFWALLKPKTPAEIQEEETRATLDKIAQMKIAGFFPTPADTVADMLAELDIQPGATVLEPSAGTGAIFKAAESQGAKVKGYEVNSTLAALMTGQGFDVTHGNFLDVLPRASYDHVAMNPPFEKGQDLQHVRHAFDHLKPGGTMVAIMGAGVTFRTDSKYQAFRDWLDTVAHTTRDLPAGTFKESGTGVASVLVWIEKGTEA